MSEIKNHLYEEDISYEDSGMEEYELYLWALKYKGKTKEEILEFFAPLWEDN